jgi:chromosome segregation ATPase
MELIDFYAEKISDLVSSLPILKRKQGEGPTAEEKEQAEIDASMKPSEDVYVPEATTVSDKKSSDVPASLALLEADVEYTRAQVEALKQNRMLIDERFAHMSEQVGELRALMVETERANTQVKLAAEKASALVETVQPERLMTQVNRLSARTEEMHALQERYDVMQKTLAENLKEVRAKLQASSSSEESLIKMREEVKADLSEIRKSELLMQRHSEKVESIFIEFERRAGEMNVISGKLEAQSDLLKDVMRTVDTIKVKVDSSVTRTDLESERGKLVDQTKKLDEALEDLQSFKELFASLFASEFEKIQKENKEDFSEFTTRLEKIEGRLSRK